MSFLGLKHTEETKELMRKNHAGGMPKGYKRSEEVKRKITAGGKGYLRRGIKLSEETKAKMRQNHKNTTPKGSKRSEQDKQRMREGHARLKLIKSGKAYLEIEGRRFRDFKQAAQLLNMAIRTVRVRVKSKAERDNDWNIVEV